MDIIIFGAYQQNEQELLKCYSLIRFFFHKQTKYLCFVPKELETFGDCLNGAMGSLL